MHNNGFKVPLGGRRWEGEQPWKETPTIGRTPTPYLNEIQAAGARPDRDLNLGKHNRVPINSTILLH